MSNFEYLYMLENKGELEILVKNKYNNVIYLAGISSTGHSVELYSIEDISGESDLEISIIAFDSNYEFV